MRSMFIDFFMVLCSVMCIGCGIFEPRPIDVEMDQINGYYKVVNQTIPKSSRVIWLYKTPLTFIDTLVDTFYTDWIHIDGDKAESIQYQYIVKGINLNYTWTYSYTTRSLATIVWRKSDNETQWIGQFNWKGVASDGTIYLTELNYIAFESLIDNKLAVSYVDNATRIIDSYTNQDPVLLREQWKKVDQIEYDHFYTMGKFY